MFCRFCGKSIPDDVKFCPKCGKDMAVPDEAMRYIPPMREKFYYVSSKSLGYAMILCVLGFFPMLSGLHCMYVGRWKRGALYALTMGLFSFGTFYDLWLIFNESFKDNDGFPLYAASSVKFNYKYREFKDNTPIVGYVVYFICLMISYCFFSCGFFFSRH